MPIAHRSWSEAEGTPERDRRGVVGCSRSILRFSCIYCFTERHTITFLSPSRWAEPKTSYAVLRRSVGLMFRLSTE